MEISAAALECPNCGAVLAAFAPADQPPQPPPDSPAPQAASARLSARRRSWPRRAEKFQQAHRRQHGILQQVADLQRALTEARQATHPRPAASPWPKWLFIPLIALALGAGIGIGLLTRPAPQTVVVLATPDAAQAVAPSGAVALAATFTSPPPTPTALPQTEKITAANLQSIGQLFYWPAGQEIVSLAFSPDGARLATGDAQGLVRVWPLWQDAPLYEIAGTVAAFSPDGRWLAVAGAAGVSLYRAQDGALERALDNGRAYYGVTFSPDSQTVVAGANDTRFHVWSVYDGSEQKGGGGFANPIHSLSFSGDGRLLATASNELTYVWNFQLQKVERNLPAPVQEPIYFSAALSGDGLWYATGLKDGQMYIWRVSNGERMAAFNDKGRFVYGLQFLAGQSSPQILISGDEVNLSFWKMTGYETALQRSIYSSAPIRSLAIAPDDRLIATGGQDGVVHIWGIQP